MIEAAGQLHETLALVAPGTVLRDGLERILRGRTGAIIVLGFDPVVEAISSGGFHLDVELSAARLRELAKMDGGVVVDMDTARIRRANVQLLPNASIQTSETGMRHRTAERVARQTGYPVISVSQSMRIISLYVDGKRHVLEPSESILASANQALSALERYKARLDQTSAGLDSLEIEDLVTVRDVTSVLQLMEMVRRISADIDSYVLELGTDGRLLALQVEELTRGLLAEHGFLLEDYLPEGLDTTTVDARLKWVGSPALLDLANRAGYPENTQGLKTPEQRTLVQNVLGSASPHTIDIATAYSTFASQGIRHDTHIVASLKNPDGSRPGLTIGLDALLDL